MVSRVTAKALTAAELLAAFADAPDGAPIRINLVEMESPSAPAGPSGVPSRWLVQLSGFPALGGERSVTAAEAVAIAGDMAIALKQAAADPHQRDPFTAAGLFVGAFATAACEALVSQYEAFRLADGSMDPATPRDPAGCAALNDEASALAGRLDRAGPLQRKSETVQ